MKVLPRIGAVVAMIVTTANVSSTEAQDAGTWHINGAISGRTFLVLCHLEQRGGACKDLSRGGQTHPLTSLTFSNNQTRWTFDTRVMLMSITLAFDGRIDGDRMSGTMTAAGRRGTFTATRG